MRKGKKVQSLGRREVIKVSAQICVAMVRLNINQNTKDSSFTVLNGNYIICAFLTE